MPVIRQDGPLDYIPALPDVSARLKRGGGCRLNVPVVDIGKRIGFELAIFGEPHHHRGVARWSVGLRLECRARPVG